MGPHAIHASKGAGAQRDETFGDLVRRIQAEYREMPGLRLTAQQARLLFGLDCVLCERVLQALVEARFLARMPDGRYVRFGADV